MMRTTGYPPVIKHGNWKSPRSTEVYNAGKSSNYMVDFPANHISLLEGIAIHKKIEKYIVTILVQDGAPQI
jgi:hypothetical protein